MYIVERKTTYANLQTITSYFKRYHALCTEWTGKPEEAMRFAKKSEAVSWAKALGKTCRVVKLAPEERAKERNDAALAGLVNVYE